MDAATYEQNEQFGTKTDARGNELTALTRRSLSHLTAAERQLHERLTDPSWARFRQVEQENIPLDVAARGPGIRGFAWTYSPVERVGVRRAVKYGKLRSGLC